MRRHRISKVKFGVYLPSSEIDELSAKELT